MNAITISIVVAMDEDRVIGLNGGLPWGRIPSDLARFRQITLGHDVIMGSNTLRSLKYPLPRRHNIIMSRSYKYKVTENNCTVAHTIDEALSSVRCSSEVFIIGGAEIYKLFLPMTHLMYVTTVYGKFQGDTIFPTWNEHEWKPVSTAEVPSYVKETPTVFRIWQRKKTPEL
jgi:dihydrofolate reductase